MATKSFEKNKHRLVPRENELQDYSLTDNIEYRKQKSIDEYITLVKKGRIRKMKAHRINSEIIEVRDKINDKDIVKQYFTHVPPVHEYDNTIRRNREKIMHFAYEDEPMTRDWHTMLIADHDKKWAKLIEIGCVIRDNDMLNLQKYFQVMDEETGEQIYTEQDIRDNIFQKSPTGYVFVPEWAGYDVFGKPRLVYDVSDIDAIKEEIYKVLEDDVIKEYSEAVIVDPYAKKNKELTIIVLIFAVLLILSDGMILYFLTK
jgi:hypothetical protein